MDPRRALTRLVEATTTGEINSLCARRGVRLLGAFGSATRPAQNPGESDATPPAPAPRDLDIAVSFAVGNRGDLLGLLDDLVLLTECDMIDLVVIDGADPVLRSEALVGVPLFENRSVADLEQLRGLDLDRIRSHPLERAAAERLLQVTVDLAIDVNAHVAASVLGTAPSTGRQSFLDAARAGAIDAALAERLAPSEGLRNVLVHQYTTIDLTLVVEAVGASLDGFTEYVAQVAAFVARLPR